MSEHEANIVQKLKRFQIYVPLPDQKKNCKGSSVYGTSFVITFSLSQHREDEGPIISRIGCRLYWKLLLFFAPPVLQGINVGENLVLLKANGCTAPFQQRQPSQCKGGGQDGQAGCKIWPQSQNLTHQIHHSYPTPWIYKCKFISPEVQIKKYMTF